LRILCVSAHPDDMEIGCAGTLLTFQREGHQITSLITVCPSAEVHDGRNKELVAAELNNSQLISGFNTIIFDTDLHEDGRPKLEHNNVTMSRLNLLIPEVDLAIIPNIEDFHQEHKNTNSLVLPILRKKAKKIWAMHSWPYCYYYNSSPTMIKNISDTWDTKLKMLSCYSSYISSQSIEQIKVTNQYWAHRANMQLAEAFTVVQDYDPS